MITRTKKLNEKTALTNGYRLEAISKGIRSPARQRVYITARLKGKSEDEAKRTANSNLARTK